MEALGGGSHLRMAGYLSLLLTRRTQFGAWYFQHSLRQLLYAGYSTLFQLECQVLAPQFLVEVVLELCSRTLRIDHFALTSGLIAPIFSYFQFHLLAV